MKKAIFLTLSFLVFFSCKKDLVEKPQKMIDKATMTNILFDVAILDAFKSNQVSLLEQNNINTTTYIFQKYGIDSLQFVENNKYYAANIKMYKKMYEEIEKRIDEATLQNDSVMKNKSQIIESPNTRKDTTKIKRKRFDINHLLKKTD